MRSGLKQPALKNGGQENPFPGGSGAEKTKPVCQSARLADWQTGGLAVWRSGGQRPLRIEPQ